MLKKTSFAMTLILGVSILASVVITGCNNGSDAKKDAKDSMDKMMKTVDTMMKKAMDTVYKTKMDTGNTKPIVPGN